MNSEQRHSTLAVLNKLSKINILGIAGTVYQTSVDEIEVLNIPLPHLVELIRDAVKRISEALDEGNKWKTLSYYDTNDRGITIRSVLTDMLNALLNKSEFDLLVPKITWLDQYGLDNQLWSESSLDSDIHASDDDLTQNLQDSIFETRKLQEQLKRLQGEIISSGAEREAVFKTFLSNEASVNEAIKQVRQSQLEAANVAGQLSSTFQQVNQNSEQFQAALDEARRSLADLHNQAEESRQVYENGMQQLSSVHEQFLGVLSNSKEKENEILNKRQEIIELRGLAADAALGGVFGKRKDELNASVSRWTWISLASFILALGWIAYVLHDYTDIKISTINWPILIINLFRTTPAIALVFFCLSQFSRERNLQEEYAFKASVSMTVNAYAEMISKEDDRIKMLVGAIQGVYIPPVIGKPFSMFSFKSKHFAEASKSAVEVAKSMQAMTADITKVAKPSEDKEKDK